MKETHFRKKNTNEEAHTSRFFFQPKYFFFNVRLKLTQPLNSLFFFFLCFCLVA